MSEIVNPLSSQQSAHTPENWLERIPVLVILALLVFLVFARTGESVHGQMTRVGELIWEDYFNLRTEVAKPTCSTHYNIEARLDELEKDAAADADDLLGSDFDREVVKLLKAEKKK